jgi:LPXTG-site transpeptidase (sortase) family protein
MSSRITPSRTKPLLRGFLFFLLFGGAILMIWPAGQSAYGWWSQRALRTRWEQSISGISKKPQRTLPQNKTASAKKIVSAKKIAAPVEKAAYAPFPPTRIVIPDINLDAVVVQGLDEGALQRGPGHDPKSVAPGQPGNCVMAAHSNIFGAWFGDLDQLWAGSLIELHTPGRIYSYRVLTSVQVAQTDLSVLAPINDGQAHLTLITCTKPASTFRHVVTAVLEE